MTNHVIKRLIIQVPCTFAEFARKNRDPRRDSAFLNTPLELNPALPSS